MPPNSAEPQPLSLDEVRKVAHLARLALTDDQLEQYRHQLGGILGHIRQLGTLNLAEVEPMSSPIETQNRLAPDEPGPMLTNEQLMAIAPARAAEQPFIAVPKVIGGGDGA